jgi:hypothetical protein
MNKGRDGIVAITDRSTPAGPHSFRRTITAYVRTCIIMKVMIQWCFVSQRQYLKKTGNIEAEEMPEKRKKYAPACQTDLKVISTFST